MGRAEEAGAAERAIGRQGLQRLLARLVADGYRLIGPVVAEGAIVLRPICGVDALPTGLPVGMIDRQEPACYRLAASGNRAWFDHAAPAEPWKRWLWPPVERLWHADRGAAGLRIVADAPPPKPLALLGVRACDLAAILALDRVFAAAGAAATHYHTRRADAVIIAVNCTRAGGTCFCASMGTGPAVGDGADIVLTELAGEADEHLLAEPRSARGAAMLIALDPPAAPPEVVAAGRAAVAVAAATMQRRMRPEVRDLLRAHPDHPAWADLGERCLGCGNCTMVCPTCFCVRIEDQGEPDGATAERRRVWDSCFALDFTELHGGAVRRTRAARYRQWMTHKLSTWWDQFGTSGCVGCGRCITWCPVGIDITREAAALASSRPGAGAVAEPAGA